MSVGARFVIDKVAHGLADAAKEGQRSGIGELEVELEVELDGGESRMKVLAVISQPEVVGIRPPEQLGHRVVADTNARNYALRMADDLPTQILIEIRDGIHQTNEQLDRTNDRLERVVQEQIRHATAIVSLEKGQHELANGQREVIKALVHINDELHGLNERLDNVLIGPLGTTVRKNTGDIDDLRRRLEALEKRAG